MSKFARTLALALLFIAATQATRGADRPSGEPGLLTGEFDLTACYAGIKGRGDRSAGLASLIEISGIETSPVACSTLPVIRYRALRALLVEEWMDAELEVVDTTFLSDLDN